MRERLIGATAIVIVAIVLIPWLVSRARDVHRSSVRRALPAPASVVVAATPPATNRTQPAAERIAASTPPAKPRQADANAAPPAPKAASKAAPARSAPIAARAAARPQGWGVQVASYTDSRPATALWHRLADAGFKVFISPHRVRGRKYLRVVVGPFPDEASARAAVPKVEAVSHTRVLVDRFEGSGG